MRSRRQVWFAGAALSFALPFALSAGAAYGAEPKAQIGKPAPQFNLKDFNGNEHKLADFKGKIVVLEWSNHQCPVCNRHVRAGTAEKVLANFKNKPVEWIGIDSTKTSAENVSNIRAWAKKTGIKYPILLDAPGEVGKLYGAKTTPHVFVIDQKGVLAYMGAMDDDSAGNKTDSRNYVEEAIRALLEGSTVATSRTDPYGCSVKYRS